MLIQDWIVQMLSRMISYAVRKGVDAQAARDVEHEAVNSLLTSWDDAPEEIRTDIRKWPAWMFAILRHKCLDFFRWQERQRHYQSWPDNLNPPTDCDPCEPLFNSELSCLLQQALDTLAEADRSFILVYVELNHNQQAVSEHFGMKITEVNNKVWKLRQHLREELLQSGVEPFILHLPQRKNCQRRSR